MNRKRTIPFKKLSLASALSIIAITHMGNAEANDDVENINVGEEAVVTVEENIAEDFQLEKVEEVTNEESTKENNHVEKTEQVVSEEDKSEEAQFEEVDSDINQSSKSKKEGVESIDKQPIEEDLEGDHLTEAPTVEENLDKSLNDGPDNTPMDKEEDLSKESNAEIVETEEYIESKYNDSDLEEPTEEVINQEVDLLKEDSEDKSNEDDIAAKKVEASESKIDSTETSEYTDEHTIPADTVNEEPSDRDSIEETKDAGNTDEGNTSDTLKVEESLDVEGIKDKNEESLTFMSVSKKNTDIEAPELITVSTDKSIYNAGEQIQLTVVAEDDTGLNGVSAIFSNDEGIDPRELSAGDWYNTVALPNGQYEFIMHIDIPESTPNLAYYLESLTLSDGEFSNSYHSYNNELDLTIEVKNDGQIDTEAPELISVTTDKSVYNAGEQIELTIIAEDETGLDEVSARFSNDDIDDPRWMSGGDSGNATTLSNGQFEYTMHIDIPERTPDVTYYLESLILNDDVFSNTYYSYNNELDLTIEVKNETYIDVDGPKLRSVDTYKTVYNAGEQIELKIVAEDETGVDWVNAVFINEEGDTPRWLSGAVGGTETTLSTDVYEFILYIDIPESTPSTTYYLESLILYDDELSNDYHSINNELDLTIEVINNTQIDGQVPSDDNMGLEYPRYGNEDNTIFTTEYRLNLIDRRTGKVIDELSIEGESYEEELDVYLKELNSHHGTEYSVNGFEDRGSGSYVTTRDLQWVVTDEKTYSIYLINDNNVSLNEEDLEAIEEPDHPEEYDEIIYNFYKSLYFIDRGTGNLLFEDLFEGEDFFEHLYVYLSDINNEYSSNYVIKDIDASGGGGGGQYIPEENKLIISDYKGYYILLGENNDNEWERPEGPRYPTEEEYDEVIHNYERHLTFIDRESGNTISENIFEGEEFIEQLDGYVININDEYGSNYAIKDIASLGGGSRQVLENRQLIIHDQKYYYIFIEENEEEPEVPEEPELPEVPEEPELPVDPDGPELPEVPEEPQLPEVPEEPELPVDSEEPVLPEAPEESELPTESDESDTPTETVTPDEEETTDTPVNTEDEEVRPTVPPESEDVDLVTEEILPTESSDITSEAPAVEESYEDINIVNISKDSEYGTTVATKTEIENTDGKSEHSESSKTSEVEEAAENDEEELPDTGIKTNSFTIPAALAAFFGGFLLFKRRRNKE